MLAVRTDPLARLRAFHSAKESAWSILVSMTLERDLTYWRSLMILPAKGEGTSAAEVQLARQTGQVFFLLFPKCLTMQS